MSLNHSVQSITRKYSESKTDLDNKSDTYTANNDYMVDEDLMNLLKLQLIDVTNEYFDLEEQINDVEQQINILTQEYGESQRSELRNNAVLNINPEKIRKNKERLNNSKDIIIVLSQTKHKIMDDSEKNKKNNYKNYNHIDQKLESIDQQLSVFYNLEKETKKLEDDIERRKVINWVDQREQIEKKLTKLRHELAKLKNDISPFYNKMHKLRQQVLIQEWKPKYLKYNDDNIHLKWPDDFRNKNNDDDLDEILITKCNLYHQQQLFNNYFIEMTCPSKNIQCKRLYIRKKHCECGFYKGYEWVTDFFNPINITDFNIDHDKPYGYLIKGLNYSKY